MIENGRIEGQGGERQTEPCGKSALLTFRCSADGDHARPLFRRLPKLELSDQGGQVGTA